MSLRKSHYNKGSADTQMVFGLTMLFLMLGFVYFRLMRYLNEVSPNALTRFTKNILDWLYGFVPVLSIISFALSALFLFGIVYVYRQYSKIIAEENKKYKPSKAVQEAEKVKNEKWERIENHIASDNPSDWKLAILEADIILDEMLEKMGYHGDSVGEKLKGVEKSDFTTIDNAWEAHKVRNSIAHEGSDFLINQREAERVIALYKTVFEEFKFI